LGCKTWPLMYDVSSLARKRKTARLRSAALPAASASTIRVPRPFPHQEILG
jgi:hypothetical protein